MTDTVVVHDPNKLLTPLEDGWHYEVQARGGYVMGGSYVNPYREIRAVPDQEDDDA